ncbi:hypothetical protein Tco_0383389 [Tanacetum coccineum]
MLCIKFPHLTTSPHLSSSHLITPSPQNSSLLFSLMSASSKTPRDYSRKHRRAILEPWRQQHNLPSSPPSHPPYRTPPTSPITTNSLSLSSPLQNPTQNQIVHDLNELHHLSNFLDITNPSPPTLLHMLDKVWEYCKDVHRDNTYWWHDHIFEEEERDEIGIEKYDPPEVQVETFEVRKYSFKGGQKFVCVTKEVDDALPLERRNKSRFKEMIRKEFDKNT